MKLLSIALIAVLSLSMISCTMFKEKAEQALSSAKVKASEKITDSIVSVGQCSGRDAIYADVSKVLKVESEQSIVVAAIAEGDQAQPLSAKSISSSLGSSVCKAAVTLVIPELLKAGVPEKYGCQLTDVSGKIQALAAEACDKI